MTLNEITGLIALTIILGTFIYLVIRLVVVLGKREQKKYDLNNEKTSYEIKLLKKQLEDYESRKEFREAQKKLMDAKGNKMLEKAETIKEKKQ